MSKIDELLKNEKVEWKKLGDIANFYGGITGKTKQDFYNGNVKFITYKNVYSNPATELNIKDLVKINEGEKQIKLEYGDILFTGSSETPDECGMSSVITKKLTEDIYLNSFCFFLRLNEPDLLLPDFSKHLFRSESLRKKIGRTASGVTRYNVSKDLMKKIYIPIPSIETQEKIVNILDKFTKYVTELQAELQARVKQYEYYRDELLSEDYLNKLLENQNLLEYSHPIRLTTLGEIGVFTRGNGLQKKDFCSEGNPVIHYGQIYTQYGFETEKTISFVNNETFSKLRKAKNNDILIATTSENIEDVGKSVVWIGKDEVGFSGDMYSYSTNENAKYIAYYFQTNEFQKQKEKKVTGTKLIRIHGDDMAKFSITIPPISIQNKVVEILDKFQSLVSETKGLLPQEIEQRQKQYEFYREKLLTFDENMIQVKSSQVKSSQVKSSQVLIASSYFTVLKEAYDILKINIASNYFYKLSDCTLNIEKINWNNLRELDYIDLSSINRENNSIIETTKINKNNAPSRAKQIVKESDILFGTTRPTLKRFYKVEKCYDGQACSTGFCVLRADTTKVIPKWIYYSIRTSNFFEYIKNNEVGTSYPSISDTKVKDYEILVPPLYVQEYVVSILDKFDSLINDINEGLPKEIELRQKQYEYYREKLLDFPR